MSIKSYAILHSPIYGVESELIDVEKSNIFGLQMRCRLNGHRGLKLYGFNLTEEMAKQVDLNNTEMVNLLLSKAEVL